MFSIIVHGQIWAIDPFSLLLGACQKKNNFDPKINLTLSKEFVGVVATG